MNAPRAVLRIALALVLFVAGELAASAHFVFVGHRVCVEHGELEHGPASCEAPAVLASEVARVDVDACAEESAPGPVFVAGDESSAEHDHCPLGDKLAPRTIPHAFRAVPALGSAAAAPLAPSSIAGERTFPLHLLAPKHSPPAAS